MVAAVYLTTLLVASGPPQLLDEGQGCWLLRRARAAAAALVVRSWFFPFEVCRPLPLPARRPLRSFPVGKIAWGGAVERRARHDPFSLGFKIQFNAIVYFLLH